MKRATHLLSLFAFMFALVPSLSMAVELPPEVSEVRIETSYFLTLGFRKESGFGISNSIKNQLTNREETVRVDANTYAKWTSGDLISEKFDLIGAIFGNDYANYLVEVESKETQQHYYITYENRADRHPHEISIQVFHEALSRLKASHGKITKVEYQGVTRFFPLESDFSKAKIRKTRPLKRYFITLEVQNETLTLSPTKNIRNSFLTHEFTIEVPVETYNLEEAWDPSVNEQSAFFSGHLSEIHGKVIGRSIRNDLKYQVVSTVDGRTLVLPTAMIDKLPER